MESSLVMDSANITYAHNPDYSRPIDPTILRLSSNTEASKSDVRQTVIGWLGDSFQSDDWELMGDQSSKHFILAFRGSGDLAAR
eukprot:11004515-Karenia_brevis.AAC.1